MSINTPIIRHAPLAVILPLRHRILRAGLPAEAAQFDNDHAADAAHFGAFAGDQLLGCATIYRELLDGQRYWRLRGMAVAETAQGLGVGRKLLDAVDQHAAANGPLSLWCNARLPAVGFYERCGWTAVSGVYDVPTAGPHRKMVRRLEIL